MPVKYTVKIVGIGPGNIKHLTIEAIVALKNADVVIFDSIIDPKILSISKQKKYEIYVDKHNSGNSSSHLQNIINLIKKYYYKSLRIVRLKIGDVMMFGGGETEYMILNTLDIKTKIIAGISSAVAACNNIPLNISKKNNCNSVIYLIAEANKNLETELIYISKMLKNNSNLIIYMAEKYINKIAQILVNNNISKDMQVVAVSDISLLNQMVLISNLREISKFIDTNKSYIFFIGNSIKIN